MVLNSNQTKQNHLAKEAGYIIDTSALIKLDPYYIDVFPALWKRLEDLMNEGRLIAPKEVQIEIHDKFDDGWNKWVIKHKKLFLDKKEIMTHVNRIQNWYPGLTDDNDTKTDADYFVIALAQYMGNWTVVTDESRKSTKIKIPYVCDKMKIPCVDLHNFFRKCSWRF